MDTIRRLRSRLEEGFSLIEILVAVVILAVGIVGIMALLPAGFTRVNRAGHVSGINHYCQLKLDELRSLDFGGPQLTAGPHLSAGLGDVGDTNYSAAWTVVDGPISGIKTITVVCGYRRYQPDGTEITTPVINQTERTFVTMITN